MTFLDVTFNYNLICLPKASCSLARQTILWTWALCVLSGEFRLEIAQKLNLEFLNKIDFVKILDVNGWKISNEGVSLNTD